MLIRIWGTSVDFAPMARLYLNEQSLIALPSHINAKAVSFMGQKYSD